MKINPQHTEAHQHFLLVLLCHTSGKGRLLSVPVALAAQFIHSGGAESPPLCHRVCCGETPGSLHSSNLSLLLRGLRFSQVQTVPDISCSPHQLHNFVPGLGKNISESEKVPEVSAKPQRSWSWSSLAS